jgi:DNA polymerase I-like protein with 3'-5' exonuclease and polymerase domains
LNDDQIIAFDFETSGSEPEYALQPWRLAQRRAWATSFVWAGRMDSKMEFHGGLAPTVDQMREMLEHAIRHRKTIAGWNVTFDMSWLIAHGLRDLVFQCRWLDGMLLWRHLDVEPEYDITDRHKKRPYTLKEAVRQFLPKHAGYEEDIDFHDESDEARAKLHRYNQRDVLFTLLITQHLLRKLEASPRQLAAAKIEAQCLPLVAETNLEGLPVDQDHTRKLSESLVKEAHDALAELEPHGVTEKVIRSPVQLSRLMFDDWQLPVIKTNTSSKTGKVSRSTDKEVLHELSFQDDRVATLRKYREALNNRTKFAEAPLKSVEYNGDDRTHPNAIVFGTYSGRFTFASKQGRGKEERQTGFALHQMKKGSEFRSVICAPEGYTLMEFDAAGQEFRWMAVASGDPTMLSLCQPGEDAHGFMGAQITQAEYRELVRRAKVEGEPEAKSSRQLGKVANLCVAGDTMVLTDRGHVPIVDVRDDDLVWDGEEFVSHDGVVFSGVRPVITYAGLTATPDHKVLVNGRWERLDAAKEHGWTIEPALGTGWSRSCRSAVRVVDGVVRRAIREIGCALRPSPVRVRNRAGCESSLSGDGPERAVQSVCNTRAAHSGGSFHDDQRGGSPATPARQRLVSTMPQPQLRILPQLRQAWDRVSIWVGARGCGVHTEAPAAPDLRASGRRPDRQRWALRTGQPAAGHTQREPDEPSAQAVYDIVNCGPRTRFAANGLIVHNSLQYRTTAPKLRSVARVDYGLPMTLPEATHIRNTYLRSYPGVTTYWRRQIAQTRATGFVETFAGRRVQVVGNWDGPLGWKMGSTAINYRIQGTGADQKYLALGVLRDYLPRIDARFGWDLHDGIYLFVPDRHVERATHEIKYLLDNLPYRKAWGFEPPVPLPWECKRGKAWGTLKEYDYD